MVAEQRETVQRIDADTTDIAANVSGAQRELLKYYASVTSNRWLMLKIFGVLIIFVSGGVVEWWKWLAGCWWFRWICHCPAVVVSFGLSFVSSSRPSAFLRLIYPVILACRPLAVLSFFSTLDLSFYY